MAIVTKTIAEVPAIDALAADDEMLVRDTSKGESARVTMQELADFVGGGGDASTWSQYPATQDVDMDGHEITGLGAPSSDHSAARRIDVTSRDPQQWAPTWNLDNMTGQPSNLDASVKVEGDYVDLVLSFEIVPTSAGIAALDATLVGVEPAVSVVHATGQATTSTAHALVFRAEAYPDSGNTLIYLVVNVASSEKLNVSAHFRFKRAA